jgi:hypothetical protein
LTGPNGKSTERVYAPDVPPTVLGAEIDEHEIDAEYRREIDSSLDRVHSQIQKAQRDGTKIILVYFPTHATIRALPAERYKQRMIFDRFPRDRYEWLDLQSSPDYQTDDGRHLVKSSAQRMAALLRQISEAAKTR